MATRRGIICWALFATVLLSACHTIPQGEGAREEGYDQLAGRDYVGARASFETALTMATDPEERSKAYLGLGKVHLKQDQPAEALRCFYEASKLEHSNEVAQDLNRALGTAYFEVGHYALAQRYLHKGLKGSSSTERQVALARLVVASVAVNQKSTAVKYKSHLRKPYSSQVKGILSTPPRPHTAACRHCAGQTSGEIGSGTDTMPVGNEYPPIPPPSTGSQKIQVLPRSEWGARSIGSNVKLMGPIDKVTVHHTGGPDFWDTSRSGAATQVRNIQRYHQKQRGWADIGYHYLVDRAGNVWQGRRLRYQGAHARGWLNHGNIGIALLGNFCNQKPTKAQYQSLSILVEKLCAHFQLTSDRVFTHGELAQGKTICPGPALTSCVKVIRKNLEKRLVAYRSSRSTTR